MAWCASLEKDLDRAATEIDIALSLNPNLALAHSLRGTVRTYSGQPLEAIPEIEQAMENPVDFKSALQELLARRGAEVSYAVTGEEGPPHDRTYTVAARVDGRELGSGRGKSKKQAEQEAARVAVEKLEG